MSELITKQDIENAKQIRKERRIVEELPKDVEILSENHPEIFNELQQVVCDSE